MPETHVNMFGGSPLNRLSWLRPSHSFLNAVINVPTTRWLVFNAGQPLINSTDGKSAKPFPAFLSTSDVKPFLGREPYFGQAEKPGELVSEGAESEHNHQHSPTEAARHLHIPIVFLGIHEKAAEDSTSALPSSEFKDPQVAIQKLNGILYLAIDVSDLEYTSEKLQEILDKTGRSVAWSEPRALMSTLDPFTAAVFASAKSLVDWNLRNKFCPACGAGTYSMWGGWKIACRSLLPWADNSNRKPCPTAKGLHNFTHPRTDGVVIMIAIDETGDRVLLGRSKKFPGKFYSALAGFIEPGESFEDAVAREMWEEAGVHVWNIKYHSGQPWPYPANLMVGFYARADSSKPIRTDLDNELVDARWFTREEVLSVLNHSTGTQFSRADHKKLTELEEGRNNADQKLTQTALTPAESQQISGQVSPNTQPDEPPFRVPPITAIAGVLIRDWAERKIGFPVDKSGEVVHKGSL